MGEGWVNGRDGGEVQGVRGWGRGTGSEGMVRGGVGRGEVFHCCFRLKRFRKPL